GRACTPAAAAPPARAAATGPAPPARRSARSAAPELCLGGRPTSTTRPPAMPSALVIDDDAHFRAFLRLALEGAGYRVREAGCAAGGVAAYRRAAADVVVCDLFMPGEGGLGVIRRLRRLSPRARVVAVSDEALVPGGLLGAASRQGAAAALLKPFAAD